MSHLFDLSTDSPEDSTPRRASKRRAAAKPDSPKPVAAAAPERRRSIGKPIGVVGGAPCPGRAFGEDCLCDSYDIYYEDRGQWLVGCAICGDESWVDVVPGVLPERDASADFVLRDGRFAGMSLDEVAGQPRGLDTLAAYADGEGEGRHEAVQKAARKYLDSRAAVS